MSPPVPNRRRFVERLRNQRWSLARLGREMIAGTLLPRFKQLLKVLPQIIERLNQLRTRGRHKRRRKIEAFLQLLYRRRENG